MPVHPRRGEGLAPAAHGAVGDWELAAAGLRWSEVLDFSVNSNPFGPPPAVVAALRTVDLSRYPDSDATALREAIAAREGLDPGQVLCGNGSVELMWLAALAFLDSSDTALILGPTFGEYERVCRIAQGQVTTFSAQPPRFQWALPEVCDRLARQRPRLLFLCNPNNPTGVYLKPADVRSLLHAAPDTLVVLDEAYLSFVPGGRSAVELLRQDNERGAPQENLLVLRSMTKDFAIAGLRLGYALGSPPVIDALRGVRPPWSVNALALAAGQAALHVPDQVGETSAELREAKRFLSRELTGLGLEVVPSSANFFLVRVGDGAAFRAALLRHGCVVRDCASFGLPQYIRVGVRTLPECRRLVEAVRAALALAPHPRPPE